MPPRLRSTDKVDPRQRLPTRIGKKLRRRILNRHYQYRDPEQIEKRLKLRYGNPSFASQVKSLEWQSVMRLSTDLYYYRDGDTWRYNLSDLISEYTGTIRYQLKNRFLRILGWLRSKWLRLFGIWISKRMEETIWHKVTESYNRYFGVLIFRVEVRK